MCPVCWATALASFGGIFAVSVLLVAGTDWWTLLLAGILAIVSAANRWGGAGLPWWCCIALSIAISVRVAYLIDKMRERLLVSRLWCRARQIAADRCPTQ